MIALVRRGPAVLISLLMVHALWQPLPPPLWGQDPALDKFFDDFTAEWVRGNPDQATGTRYFSGAEQDALERQVTPWTLEWRQKRTELARQGLVRLRAIHAGTQETQQQRVSADLLRWSLEIGVEGEKWRDYRFPIQAFDGANIYLVDTLTVAHPLRTAKDAENYLARLRLISGRMDEAREEAARIAGKKLIPPRSILQTSSQQIKRFTETVPAQNPLVTIFAEKIGAISAISPDQRERLRGEAEKIVSEQVIPAWKKSAALLDRLSGGASDDAGLWRFPRGAEAYAYFLRLNTTTNLTADEIHGIGLREVARIEREMDAILRGMGRSSGTVSERYQQLRRERAYPATEEGRKQIMADADAIIRDAEKRAATMFAETPKAPVVAEPVPKYQEANSAANYTPPPLDGSRPGTVRLPLRPNWMTRVGLKSVVYHEGVPGHHYQIALQVENKGLPRFRQIRAFGGFTAYSEGWGLYAERLAADSGWYDGDPEGRLGQLDWELFRARRLVVDTGLHAKKWTRQQAIDYGIEPSEVDRYIVNPGQACAYMIGELKFIELRERARKALGERFDIKQYHKLVLDIGTAPLEIVERQVDEWIRSSSEPRP